MLRRLGAAMSLILVGSLLNGIAQPVSAGPALPSGFQEHIVFAGLTDPTNLEFAPNGLIFVAEKGGKVKVFDNLGDPDPTLFADLSAKVFNLGDRGLLGLAIHPQFPVQPWIYVLYTLDAPPGQSAPYWNDNCTYWDGSCVVTGRLSRLRADATGKVMTGSEQVLVEGWCQQWISHSTDDLKFGVDGMLYVTGGDGASFTQVDYGQVGNPCGDPAFEGGAVRSQSLRSATGPVLLNGAILRLNPENGAAAPGNPFLFSPDPNKRLIVGYGLRNPYRMTMRPGTSEVWIGDTGWNSWEDIDRLVDPLAMTPQNFGWPCYEGNGQQSEYASSGIPLCGSLYAAGSGAVSPPFLSYDHVPTGQPGQGCDNNGYSPSGLVFYPHSGGVFPAEYGGSLFIADYSRKCIYVMKTAQQGGLPSPSLVSTFAEAASPTDLELGPDNELYYVSLGGTVRAIRYYSSNRPPVAHIDAGPVTGNPPLTVTFDASASSDADAVDQGQLTYQWDFTNNGSFDTTGVAVEHTYSVAASYTARLKVTDLAGASSETTVAVHVNGFPPTPTMDSPSAALTWKVGQTVSFSGSAADPDDGVLPAASLKWELRMQHCVVNGGCHTHPLQSWNGVASGSFTAPDHELPAHLELVLTATDSSGQTSSITRPLNPKPVSWAVQTQPAGLQLTTDAFAGAAPFTVDLIDGAQRTVYAPSSQFLNGVGYRFIGWSDGGAQRHTVSIGPNEQPLTATFLRCSGWIHYLGLPGCTKIGPDTPRMPGEPSVETPVIRF